MHIGGDLMRMTISQLEECKRLLSTTCRLQFQEPPQNYELGLRQLNSLYRQINYQITHTPKYNHIAVIICLSEHNGELCYIAYEHTGRKGRPRKVFIPNGNIAVGKQPEAHPHLHCYFAGANSFSLANQICTKQNGKAKKQGKSKPVLKSAKSSFSVDYCRQQASAIREIGNVDYYARLQDLV